MAQDFSGELYARHEPHCFEGWPERDPPAREKAHIYYPKREQQQDHPDTVGRVVAMRTNTHRFVYRPTGQSELYNLATDPQELYNLYGNPAHAAVQQKLERKLLDWTVQTSDITPFATDPRGYR